MRKIKEEGVTFRSPIDGSKVFLSPEISMEIQQVLNSDIVMIFDECTPYPATHEEAQKSLQLYAGQNVVKPIIMMSSKSQCVIWHYSRWHV